MALHFSLICCLGIIILLLDLLIFCTFVSRVHVSFNKRYRIDDEWNQNNDFWLKLSRISGVIFSFFHIGAMSIVITETLNINMNNSQYPHIYLLSQSLWTLSMNLSICAIAHRMYRVYKSTSTSFTPLKRWMASNGQLVEYFIWSTFALIASSIVIQYILIITSNTKHIFLISAFQNFCSAMILFIQLIIALFFCYIAHKSQQQTNWNEQSKAIICKESAKLAFIVSFLAFFVVVLLFRMIWYFVHWDDDTYSLRTPYSNTTRRIYWAILEFFGFWLISYLTRLRKPPSDNNNERTLSFKGRRSKQQQQQMRLEQRKKAFVERERKRANSGYLHVAVQSNSSSNAASFNQIFMKQVAKYEEEKKVNEIKTSQMLQSKSVNVDDDETKNIADDAKGNMDQTRPRYNRVHLRLNQSDPLLHMTLGNFMMKEINQTPNADVTSPDLNVLEESKTDAPSKLVEASLILSPQGASSSSTSSESEMSMSSEKVPFKTHDSMSS